MIYLARPRHKTVSDEPSHDTCTVNPNRLMSTEDVNKTVETMVSTRITTLVRCVVCDT